MASDERPLRLLSLDGGGVRGLSSLLILQRIMHVVNRKQQAESGGKQSLRPCEYFDIIAGTSTGGLIAIMLGTLCMSVDDCITSYQDFAPKIFPKEGFRAGNPMSKFFKAVGGKARFDATSLEEEVKKMVQSQLAPLGLDENAIFDKIEWPSERKCHVIVCAGVADVNSAVRLRSYSSRWEQSKGCTVWEAARATSAAPLYFDPISFGVPPMKYIDGALRYNNPVRVLYDETKSEWPGRPIACVVSIGTGNSPPASGGPRLDQLLRSMKEIVTDTKQAAMDFANDLYHEPDKIRPAYFRFNVEQGLEAVGLQEWTQFGKLTAATAMYLDEKRREIDECADAILAMTGRSDDEKKQTERDWTAEESKCEQLLRNSDYESFKDRNPSRVKETCQWFLEHPNFQSWHQSNTSSLLWVSADPGCGKSVLSKSLVENELQSSESRTTCYFFFKDDDVLQKSVTHALSALLHQLFSQKKLLIQHAVPDYRSEGTNLPTSFHKLWTILTKAAMDPKAGEVVCILDALDECEESGRYSMIQALSTFYKKAEASKETYSKFKFLVTSRPYLDIERRFTELTYKVPTVRLQGEKESEAISVEINRVIHFEAHERIGLELKLNDSEKLFLEKKLSSMPHRTYLWLQLVLEVIRGRTSITPKRIQQLISNLPPTVEAAYEAILEKSSDKALARKLLCLIVAAVRPLTLQEMNIALAIEDHHRRSEDLDLEDVIRFESTVRHLCGLFVTVVDQKIYLIHQTAKEFLLANPELCSGVWKYSIEPDAAQLIITKSCITYLLFTEFNSESEMGWKDDATRRESETKVGQDTDEFHYLSYAASQWAYHYLQVKATLEPEILQSILNICDTGSQRYKNWFYVYWYLNQLTLPPQFINSILVGSYFGHEAVVKQLLARSTLAADSIDKYFGRTPLSWAAERGHDTIVKLLLATDGVDADSTDTYYRRSPLSWAALRGHVVIVELLLATSTVTVDSRDRFHRTPLSWAAYQGNEAVVKLLLATDAVDIDSKDKFGRTPLSCAAYRGHESIVKLLLATDAVDTNSEDHFGRTPLSCAAYEGHDGIVKLLLATDAVDINSKDIYGRTPLGGAAKFGHEAAVMLLLANCAVDVDSEDSTGRTALDWATRGDNEGVVKLLQGPVL